MRKVLYFLGQLDDRDVEWMIANGSIQRISTGTVLIRQGVPPDALYFVLEGELSIQVDDEEIMVHGAGEVVGEVSFVDDRPASATVKASSNTAVLTLPVDRVQEKIEADDAFGKRFYKAIAVYLADRLRTANLRIESLSTLPYIDTEINLGDNLLDNVYMAGLRFEQMLKSLVEQ